MYEQLNLQLTLNADGSITANWSPITDLKRYMYYVSAIGEDVAICIDNNYLGTTFTTPAGLEANKQYRVLVVGYKNSSTVTVSDAKTILIHNDFYKNLPLDIPQNITATASTVSVTISFDEVNRASGYDILFNNTVYSVTKSNKTINGLTPKTEYTYAVRAKNSVRTGDYSETKTIRTLPISPAIPSGIQKTATETTATISWGAVNSATGYDLIFNGTTYAVTGTSKTFTGLTMGTGYPFQIRAKNADASSAYTSVYTVTTSPGIPTGITASSTDTTVTLSWNKPAGAVGYKVKWNNVEMSATDSTVTFTGLTPDTTYSYQVCARSADGIGTYSTSYTIRTQIQPLTVPQNIIKSSTESTASISWSAVSGATGYDIIFDGRSYSTTQPTRTFTGLKENTNYSFQIRAKNARDTGEYCEVQSVQTTPKMVSVPEVSTNENSVTINWEPVTGATSYDLEFNNQVYNLSTTSKTITGLSPNTSYNYRVRVNNADGSSSYSSMMTVFTTPLAPPTPTVTVTPTSVMFSWAKVLGASSYDILFNNEIYNVTSTVKTITGLTPKTTYSYAMRSNNAYGSSNYSATRTVKTGVILLSPPTGISATSTTNSVTVQWNAVSGATSYDLLFAGQTYRVTETSKTITGLKHSTDYLYCVRANNADGSGNYSAASTIKTQLDIPDIPINVGASSTSYTATVSWSEATGAESYDVLFDGTVYNVSSLSKTFTDLSPNTNYTYSVCAKNSVGTSEYSAEKTVQTLIGPPGVPTDITATATEYTVTVSWSPVDTATYYEVLFAGSVYSSNTTSITISSLECWTDYSYAVRAGNVGGVSNYSEHLTIKTLLAIPSTPLGLLVNPDVYSIQVIWNKVNAAETYDVLINDTVHNSSATELNVTGLTPGTQYRVSVCAKNSLGSSTYSSVLAIYTKLPIPSNIDAVATEETLLISWDSVEGATGYEVELNGKNYSTQNNHIEFNELDPGTRYTFRLRAYNANVISDYSEINYVETGLGIPTNIYAETTFSSIFISWDPVQNATGYEVSLNGEIYSVTSSSNTPMRMKTLSIAGMGSRSSTGTEKPCITIDGLPPGTEYAYQVRATNGSVMGPFSALQSIFTQGSINSWVPSGSHNAYYFDGKIPNLGMDPVNPLTGGFLWSYTLLQDYGKDGLHFTLMYDSKREDKPRVLGNKWTHSLNYLLYTVGEHILFGTPYDEVVCFIKNQENDEYQAAENMRLKYSLIRGENNTYIVKIADGTEYIFDADMKLSQIRVGGVVEYEFTMNENGEINKVIGRYGAVLNLQYTDGKITGVTDGMNQEMTLSYSGEYLASVTNASELSMQFSYDLQGNLLEIHDFSGAAYLTNVYDAKGRVISQNIIGRGESVATYNEIDRVTTFTDELGNMTKYHYDENYCITRIEMAGMDIQNRYDADGRLVEQIDGLGNSTRMAYDEKGRMSQVLYADGKQEQVVYNDNNKPVEVINRDETKSTYEYDGRNNLISATDERGNKGSYIYDEKDNLISYQDKEGSLWKYTYDEQNHLRQAEDPEGNIYIYNHDILGRLVSYTSPMGKTTAYTYAETGELMQVVDPSGTVAFTYNENGNNTGVTDALGNSQRLEYNAMGQVILATDYMGNEYHFTYDEKGNLIRETDPLNYTVNYTYDGRGNRTGFTDKNGETTSYTFNEGNQLVAVQDAAGGMIRYTYDTMGQIIAVMDARDNQTAYDYDAMGRLICITNALGHTINYTYDQLGNLLTQTAENGAVTSYEYDKENRLTSVVSEAGRVTFTYDKLGRVIAVEDVDTHSEAISYDGDGNIISALDKENHQTTYAYDESGRLIKETNPLGAQTVYDYDANGNCIQITDAKGNKLVFAYNANGQVIKETDPLGRSTIYEYDERGMLKSAADAKGGKTTYTYDGNGNCIKKANPDGGEVVYVYDGLNRIIEIQDEEGHIQKYLYDTNGNLTVYTDANGNQWEYTYDALNRLTCVEDNTGSILNYEYTKAGQIAAVTDQEGVKTRYQYDLLGRLIEMSDALEHQIRFTYDSLGRVLTETDGNGNTMSYEYSPTGCLTKIVDREGNETTYTHNALGQVLTETNALGATKSYAYDVLGRVEAITDEANGTVSFTYTANSQIESVTNATGSRTAYQYDANGNLCQVTDALGNTVSFEYDVMNNRIKECMTTDSEQHCITLYQYDKKGRMIKELNPLSNTREYTYDGNGNITRILDEEEQVTTVTYDLNNRPLTMHYSDGKRAVFRYDKRGELVEINDWSGKTLLEHDQIGRLTSVTDPNAHVTGYGYDSNGNVTSVTYPDGSVVHYGFDKNNRMKKVSDTEGKETVFSYDAVGNVTLVTQPGSSAAYTYNEKGLPITADYQFGDGTVQENRFTYDPIGRILSCTRTGSAPCLAGQTEYTYDAVGRLLSYKEGQKTEAYVYDRLGNRIQKQINGVEQATYQYNALNQLILHTENGITESFHYDRRGNLIEEKQADRRIRQYSYDSTGRMYQGKNMQTGEITQYQYNALMMRTGMIQSRLNPHGGRGEAAYMRQESKYVNDFLSTTGNELMAYQTDSCQVRTVYGPSYMRLSQNVTSQADVGNIPEGNIAANVIGKAWFQSDLWGSVRFASNEQGQLLRYGERRIWGDLMLPMLDDLNVAGMKGNFRFTTYDYDPVLDKYFAQARFYDSRQGRMLGMDPVRRSLNGYSYCENDPVNHVDPTGEVLNVIGGGLLGGLVGGAFGFVGSAISQVASGQKFDVKKALGSAANGAITGAVQGAIVSSGVGLGVSLAANFVAGGLGSAAEQQITTGRIDAGKVIANGVANAATGYIYRNGLPTSLKSAVVKGAQAGAITSGINYVANNMGTKTSQRENVQVSTTSYVRTPVTYYQRYESHRDPRNVSGATSPSISSVRYVPVRGYQYSNVQTQTTIQTTSSSQSSFSLGGLAKEMLIGGLTGAAAGGTFYGIDRATQAIAGSIRNVGGSKSGKGSNIDGAINNGQPLNNHRIVPDSEASSLPAAKQTPNSSADLLNPDGSAKQRRYYGEDGKAQMDIDFNHTDDGTHEFPHIHIWDWTKNPPRQDSRR